MALVAKLPRELAMRGSTIDQVRHDIDPADAPADADDTVAEQIDAAEKAAGLQSMFPPQPDKTSNHGLWFAIGAGLLVAAIVVAVAVI
jgi:hypothetical protein